MTPRDPRRSTAFCAAVAWMRVAAARRRAMSPPVGSSGPPRSHTCWARSPAQMPARTSPVPAVPSTDGPALGTSVASTHDTQLTSPFAMRAKLPEPTAHARSWAHAMRCARHERPSGSRPVRRASSRAWGVRTSGASRRKAPGFASALPSQMRPRALTASASATSAAELAMSARTTSTAPSELPMPGPTRTQSAFSASSATCSAACMSKQPSAPAVRPTTGMLSRCDCATATTGCGTASVT